jgi:hypothetical protein
MSGKQLETKHRATQRHPPGESARSSLVAQPQEADPFTLQRAIADPAQAQPADILRLQKAAGNRAVTGLIQAKLTVGGAGDRYEQEADRVAEQIMQMGKSANLQMGRWANGPLGAQLGMGVQRQEEEEEVQTKPLAATITPIVQRQEEEEEEVQTKPLVQRQEEEEEEVQTKPLVQRQEEEEEEVQTKPLVQRQEEEEEEVQTRPLVQRQEEEEEEVQTRPLVQRQEEEEEEVQTKPLVQRQEEEEEVQTKLLAQRAQADGSFQAGPGLENRLAAQKGGGSPLPAGLRASMEPRFGADFSGVRVHTGGEAAQLNRTLNSKAFTHGQDIYFRSGEYSPETRSGQKLLAHELTHTLQQGVAQRIQGWWPKGHRLVTELAFQEGGLGRYYGAAARRFLIDRSPDMDFIQDVFETMGEGAKESVPRLEMYKNLIETGHTAQARQMYRNNDLHIRRPAYLLMHGEAGGYKERDASAKNAAVTVKFVEKAVGLWNRGENMEALSVLSDALHQAGDRGSHEEGNAFGGHDVRIQLGVKGKGKIEGFGKQTWPRQQWERAMGGEKVMGQKWEPDNFSVNKRGAVHGVACVIGALKKFVDGIGLEEGEQINVRGLEVPKKRKLKAKAFLPKAPSWGPYGRLGAQVAKAKTGGGKESLEKVFEETKPSMQRAYQIASQTPGDAVPEGFADLLQDGMRFYQGGLARSEVYQAAYNQFFDWSRSRLVGGLKASKRRQESVSYYNREVQAAEGKGRDKVLTGKHIKLAYKSVFLESLPVEEPREQATGVKLAVQLFDEAIKQFKKWGKARGRGGLKTSTRKTQSRQYYLQNVAGYSGQALKLRAGAIKAAYYSVFKEKLIA